MGPLRKKNGMDIVKIVLLASIIIMAGISGFLYYRTNQISSQLANLQTSYDELEAARNDLQNEKNALQASFNDLLSQKNALQASFDNLLSQKNRVIYY